MVHQRSIIKGASDRPQSADFVFVMWELGVCAFSCICWLRVKDERERERGRQKQEKERLRKSHRERKRVSVTDMVFVYAELSWRERLTVFPKFAVQPEEEEKTITTLTACLSCQHLVHYDAKRPFRLECNYIMTIRQWVTVWTLRTSLSNNEFFRILFHLLGRTWWTKRLVL